MNVEQLINRFESDGYAVLSEVLSKEYVGNLRTLVEQLYSGRIGRSEGLPDIVEIPVLRDLIAEPKILSAIRALAGDENIVYIPDSAIHKGDGIAGWHKDIRSTDRYDLCASDWESDYKIYRVGIYLQRLTGESGGLMLKAGSHNRSQFLKVLFQLIKGLLDLKLVKVTKLDVLLKIFRIYLVRFLGAARFLNTDVGDVAIWSLRTTHSGGARRLEFAPDFPIDPFLQKHIPKRFFKASTEERMVVFFAFGVPGPHLDRYVEYVSARADFQDRFPNGMRLSEEASNFLKANKLA